VTAVVLDIASWALILLGSVFVVIGAFGMVRMPDVFTRMHAASVVDTLGMAFLLFGMMLQAGFTLVTLKLVFLVALFVLTTPVVTHALARACLHEGIQPVLAHDRRNRSQKQPPPSNPGSEP
jgi:multicomponent Na+:H+ antiporter subunit G